MLLKNIKTKFSRKFYRYQIPNVFLKTLAALVLSALGLSQISFACSMNESGPMPICEMPYIASDERIAVFRFDQMIHYTDIDVIPQKPANQDKYWGNTWQFGLGHHSYVTDVRIGKLTKPVTLILSSYEAAIIRVIGDIENVSRVIVLGSRQRGPGAIGVVGIDPAKVEHVLVEGQDETRLTDCSAPPQSCVPSQFFKLDEHYMGHLFMTRKMKPYTPLRPVAASSSTFTDRKGKSHKTPFLPKTDSVDLVEGVGGLKINLNLETYLRQKEGFSVEKWRSVRKKHGAYGQFLKYDKTLVDTSIDVESIISPYRFKKSDQFPGWYGIEELHRKGALLLRTDEAFKRRYDDYIARSDEWNAERTLKMDIILLKNIEILPRNLRDRMQTLVIFVPDGIKPPKIPHNTTACFVFETSPVKNRRDLNRACRNPENRY